MFSSNDIFTDLIVATTQPQSIFNQNSCAAAAIQACHSINNVTSSFDNTVYHLIRKTLDSCVVISPLSQNNDDKTASRAILLDLSRTYSKLQEFLNNNTQENNDKNIFAFASTVVAEKHSNVISILLKKYTDDTFIIVLTDLSGDSEKYKTRFDHTCYCYSAVTFWKTTRHKINNVAFWLMLITMSSYPLVKSFEALYEIIMPMVCERLYESQQCLDLSCRPSFLSKNSCTWNNASVIITAVLSITNCELIESQKIKYNLVVISDYFDLFYLQLARTIPSHETLLDSMTYENTFFTQCNYVISFFIRVLEQRQPYSISKQNEILTAIGKLRNTVPTFDKFIYSYKPTKSQKAYGQLLNYANLSALYNLTFQHLALTQSNERLNSRPDLVSSYKSLQNLIYQLRLLEHQKNGKHNNYSLPHLNTLIYYHTNKLRCINVTSYEKRQTLNSIYIISRYYVNILIRELVYLIKEEHEKNYFKPIRLLSNGILCLFELYLCFYDYLKCTNTSEDLLLARVLNSSSEFCIIFHGLQAILKFCIADSPDHITTIAKINEYCSNTYENLKSGSNEILAFDLVGTKLTQNDLYFLKLIANELDIEPCTLLDSLFGNISKSSEETTSGHSHIIPAYHNDFGIMLSSYFDLFDIVFFVKFTVGIVNYLLECFVNNTNVASTRLIQKLSPTMFRPVINYNAMSSDLKLKISAFGLSYKYIDRVIFTKRLNYVYYTQYRLKTSFTLDLSILNVLANAELNDEIFIFNQKFELEKFVNDKNDLNGAFARQSSTNNHSTSTIITEPAYASYFETASKNEQRKATVKSSIPFISKIFAEGGRIIKDIYDNMTGTSDYFKPTQLFSLPSSYYLAQSLLNNDNKVFGSWIDQQNNTIENLNGESILKHYHKLSSCQSNNVLKNIYNLEELPIFHDDVSIQDVERLLQILESPKLRLISLTVFFIDHPMLLCYKVFQEIVYSSTFEIGAFSFVNTVITDSSMCNIAWGTDSEKFPLGSAVLSELVTGSLITYLTDEVFLNTNMFFSCLERLLTVTSDLDNGNTDIDNNAGINALVFVSTLVLRITKIIGCICDNKHVIIQYGQLLRGNSLEVIKEIRSWQIKLCNLLVNNLTFISESWANEEQILTVNSRNALELINITINTAKLYLNKYNQYSATKNCEDFLQDSNAHVIVTPVNSAGTHDAVDTQSAIDVKSQDFDFLDELKTDKLIPSNQICDTANSLGRLPAIAIDCSGHASTKERDSSTKSILDDGIILKALIGYSQSLFYFFRQHKHRDISYDNNRNLIINEDSDDDVNKTTNTVTVSNKTNQDSKCQCDFIGFTSYDQHECLEFFRIAILPYIEDDVIKRNLFCENIFNYIYLTISNQYNVSNKGLARPDNNIQCDNNTLSSGTSTTKDYSCTTTDWNVLETSSTGKIDRNYSSFSSIFKRDTAVASAVLDFQFLELSFLQHDVKFIENWILKLPEYSAILKESGFTCGNLSNFVDLLNTEFIRHIRITLYNKEYDIIKFTGDTPKLSLIEKTDTFLSGLEQRRIQLSKQLNTITNEIDQSEGKKSSDGRFNITSIFSRSLLGSNNAKKDVRRANKELLKFSEADRSHLSQVCARTLIERSLLVYANSDSDDFFTMWKSKSPFKNVPFLVVKPKNKEDETSIPSILQFFVFIKPNLGSESVFTSLATDEEITLESIREIRYNKKLLLIEVYSFQAYGLGIKRILQLTNYSEYSYAFCKSNITPDYTVETFAIQTNESSLVNQSLKGLRALKSTITPVEYSVMNDLKSFDNVVVGTLDTNSLRLYNLACLFSGSYVYSMNDTQVAQGTIESISCLNNESLNSNSKNLLNKLPLSEVSSMPDLIRVLFSVSNWSMKVLPFNATLFTDKSLLTSLPSCYVENVNFWRMSSPLLTSLSIFETNHVSNSTPDDELNNTAVEVFRHGLQSQYFARLMSVLICPFNIIYSSTLTVLILPPKLDLWSCNWKQSEELPPSIWFNHKLFDIPFEDLLNHNQTSLIQYREQETYYTLFNAQKLSEDLSTLPELNECLKIETLSDIIITCHSFASFDEVLEQAKIRVHTNLMHWHKNYSVKDFDKFMCCYCHYFYYLNNMCYGVLNSYINELMGAIDGFDCIYLPRYKLKFTFLNDKYNCNEYSGYYIDTSIDPFASNAILALTKVSLRLINDIGDSLYIVDPYARPTALSSPHNGSYCMPLKLLLSKTNNSVDPFVFQKISTTNIIVTDNYLAQVFLLLLYFYTGNYSDALRIINNESVMDYIASVVLFNDHVTNKSCSVQPESFDYSKSVSLLYNVSVDIILNLQVILYECSSSIDNYNIDGVCARMCVLSKLPMDSANLLAVKWDFKKICSTFLQAYPYLDKAFLFENTKTLSLLVTRYCSDLNHNLTVLARYLLIDSTDQFNETQGVKSSIISSVTSLVISNTKIELAPYTPCCRPIDLYSVSDGIMNAVSSVNEVVQTYHSALSSSTRAANLSNEEVIAWMLKFLFGNNNGMISKFTSAISNNRELNLNTNFILLYDLFTEAVRFELNSNNVSYDFAVLASRFISKKDFMLANRYANAIKLFTLDKNFALTVAPKFVYDIQTKSKGMNIKVNTFHEWENNLQQCLAAYIESNSELLSTNSSTHLAPKDAKTHSSLEATMFLATCDCNTLAKSDFFLDSLSKSTGNVATQTVSNNKITSHHQVSFTKTTLSVCDSVCTERNEIHLTKHRCNQLIDQLNQSLTQKLLVNKPNTFSREHMKTRSTDIISFAFYKNLIERLLESVKCPLKQFISGFDKYIRTIEFRETNLKFSTNLQSEFLRALAASSQMYKTRRIIFTDLSSLVKELNEIRNIIEETKSRYQTSFNFTIWLLYNLLNNYSFTHDHSNNGLYTELSDLLKLCLIYRISSYLQSNLNYSNEKSETIEFLFAIMMLLSSCIKLMEVLQSQIQEFLRIYYVKTATSRKHTNKSNGNKSSSCDMQANDKRSDISDDIQLLNLFQVIYKTFNHSFNYITDTFDASSISVNLSYAVFEFVNCILFRSIQTETIGMIIDKIQQNNSICKQLMMGEGKTTIITPAICALLLNSQKAIFCVVPDYLISFTYSSLKKRLAIKFDVTVSYLSFTRYNQISTDLIEMLRSSNHKRVVFVTSASSIKAIFLKYLLLKFNVEQTCQSMSRIKQIARDSQILGKALLRKLVNSNFNKVLTNSFNENYRTKDRFSDITHHKSKQRFNFSSIKKTVKTIYNSTQAASPDVSLTNNTNSKSLKVTADQELKYLTELLDHFHNRSILILDECDVILHPLKSELRWPIGNADQVTLQEFCNDNDYSSKSNSGKDDYSNYDTVLQESKLRTLIAWHFCELIVRSNESYRSTNLKSQCCICCNESSDLESVKSNFSVVQSRLVQEGLAINVPHFVLLTNDCYDSRLKSIIVDWFALFCVSNKLLSTLSSDSVNQFKRSLLGHDTMSSLFKKDYENASSKTQFYVNVTSKLAVAAISLIAQWVNHYGKFVLTKTYRVNYGLLNPHSTMLNLTDDITSRSVFAIPFVAKDRPSESSEFANVDITIYFTCMSYVMQGLSLQLVILCILDLKAQRKQETYIRLEDSTASQTYNKWITTAGGRVKGNTVQETADMFDMNHGTIAIVSLDVFEPCNYVMKRLLHKLLHKSLHVTHYMLINILFPTLLKSYNETLVSNGQELGSNILFTDKVGFSGTPNDLLPPEFGKCYYQQDCDATILSVLTSRSICSLVFVPNNSLSYDLVDHMIGNNCNVIIDVGGLMIDRSNAEIARYILTKYNNMFDECVFFLDNTDKKMVLVLNKIKQGFDEQPFTSQQSKHRRIVYFDQSHYFGQDIPLTIDAKAGVTVGKDCSFRDIAQGAWRLRQIQQGQSVVFIITESLRSIIRNTKTIITNEAVSSRDVDSFHGTDELVLLCNWTLVQSEKSYNKLNIFLQRQSLENLCKAELLSNNNYDIRNLFINKNNISDVNLIVDVAETLISSKNTLGTSQLTVRQQLIKNYLDKVKLHTNSYRTIKFTTHVNTEQELAIDQLAAVTEIVQEVEQQNEEQVEIEQQVVIQHATGNVPIQTKWTKYKPIVSTLTFNNIQKISLAFSELSMYQGQEQPLYSPSFNLKESNNTRVPYIMYYVTVESSVHEIDKLTYSPTKPMSSINITELQRLYSPQTMFNIKFVLEFLQDSTYQTLPLQNTLQLFGFNETFQTFIIQLLRRAKLIIKEYSSFGNIQERINKNDFIAMLLCFYELFDNSAKFNVYKSSNILTTCAITPSEAQIVRFMLQRSDNIKAQLKLVSDSIYIFDKRENYRLNRSLMQHSISEKHFIAANNLINANISLSHVFLSCFKPLFVCLIAQAFQINNNSFHTLSNCIKLPDEYVNQLAKKESVLSHFLNYYLLCQRKPFNLNANLQANINLFTTSPYLLFINPKPPDRFFVNYYDYLLDVKNFSTKHVKQVFKNEFKSTTGNIISIITSLTHQISNINDLLYLLRIIDKDVVYFNSETLQFD